MKNEKAVAIGIRINLRRTDLRMTRQELAVRVGVSRQTVQAWEKGENIMGADKLCVLAEALDVPAIYIAAG